MKDYILVVPSRERAAWLDKRGINGTLPNVKHLDPVFMVRDDDSQLKTYEFYAEKHNTELSVYDGTGIYGAAQTYDMIINAAVRMKVEKLLILDDDLSFAMHNPIIGATPIFRRTTPDETTTLLQHIVDLTCKQVPMMSLTPIMKRSQPALVSYCVPMMMAYSIYVPHFRDHPEHRFWVGKHIEARCDLNLTLKMLTSGFLTAFMASCFIPDNVNNPGGCSTYRDIECEKASVAYLKSTYPGFVSTRLKRGWVGDANIVREAPVIQWKEAFNYAAFREQFGERAIDFTTRHLATYETMYANFIKELRK